MKTRILRTLAAAVLMALLTGLFPAALASTEAVVAASPMKIYRKSEPHDQIGTLPKGTVVTVLDYNSKAALISFQGREGIVRVGDLKAIDSKKTTEKPAPAEEEETTADDTEVTRYDSRTVWTADTATVYAKPDTSSKSVQLVKGVRLRLLATRGDWAMVEKSGNIGYMDISDLTSTEVSTEEIETGETYTPSTPSFSGSNEEVIYRFLTQVVGYNTAAACGVLSNIMHESSYKPTTVGDGGTSYGIAQWHASRKTRLIDWCSNHGYDYTSLKGQLYYLQYELKTYYPSVHSKLKSVSNSAQGAYDAGYYFCYNFEAPASRAQRSVTRGNYAKDKLWVKYRV